MWWEPNSLSILQLFLRDDGFLDSKAWSLSLECSSWDLRVDSLILGMSCVSLSLYNGILTGEGGGVAEVIHLTQTIFNIPGNTESSLDAIHTTDNVVF